MTACKFLIPSLSGPVSQQDVQLPALRLAQDGRRRVRGSDGRCWLHLIMSPPVKALNAKNVAQIIISATFLLALASNPVFAMPARNVTGGIIAARQDGDSSLDLAKLFNLR